MIRQWLSFTLISGILVSCDSSPKSPAVSVEGQSPIDSIQAELAKDPTNAQAFAKRSLLELKARNLRAAQEHAIRAIQLDSNDTYVLESYGDVFFVLNQTRKSRDSWLRCVELNDQNVSCRLKLAELYFTVRNHQLALDQLNKVLLIEGRNPMALFLKGNVYKEIGDTANAIAFIQSAIDADPKYFDAYDQMGVLYAAKRDSLAVIYYKKAMELRPNESNTYYNLGVYYQEQELWNRALEAYASAIQVDPKHFNSHYNMGYINVLLKVWDQGAVHFTDALNAKNDFLQAYYGRAYCFEMLGDVAPGKAGL